MARSFAASDNQYLITTTTPVTANPVTMACWANPNNATAAMAVMHITDSAGAVNWLLFMTIRGDVGGDPLRAFVRTSGGISTMSGGTFSANVWNHFAQRSGSDTDHETYLDGSSIATDANSRAPASIDRIGIGTEADSVIAPSFDGGIAEWAIWDVSLTDTQITILSKGFQAPFVQPGSLVLYARGIRGDSSGDDRDTVGGVAFVSNGDSLEVTNEVHPRMIPWGSMPFMVGDVVAAAGGSLVIPRQALPMAVLGR